MALNQQGQPQQPPAGVPPPVAQPPAAVPAQQLANNQHVARQLSNLCMELKMSQVAPHIRPFNGEGHQRFQDWLKDMEKSRVQCAGDDDRMRNLAVATLTGPAADFLLRVIEHTPQVTRNQIKQVLKQRYSDLADVQYARQSMRNLRQTKTESVQNFGERIIAVAQEAYPGQNLNDPTIQGQLVEIFASGLKDTGIMKHIVRKRPVDLDRAIILAAAEQQAIKSFELSRSHRREEDMEIDLVSEKQSNMEKQLENLTKQMLTLTECMQQISQSRNSQPRGQRGRGPQHRFSGDGRPICYQCQKVGHVARDCRQGRPPVRSQHPATQSQSLN